MKRELVLKEGKVYVLKDEKLRTEIIRLHHDVLIAGHGGKWKTVELVTRNYYQKLLVARSDKRSRAVCGRV